MEGNKIYNALFSEENIKLAGHRVDLSTPKEELTKLKQAAEKSRANMLDAIKQVEISGEMAIHWYKQVENIAADADRKLKELGIKDDFFKKFEAFGAGGIENVKSILKSIKR